MAEQRRSAGNSWEFGVWVLIGFLTLIYFLPILLLLRLGIWNDGFQIAPLIKILKSPSALRSLGATFELATTTSLVCLALGYPLAYYLVKSGPRRRAVLMVLLILPSGRARWFAPLPGRRYSGATASSMTHSWPHRSWMPRQN